MMLVCTMQEIEASNVQQEKNYKKLIPINYNQSHHLQPPNQSTLVFSEKSFNKKKLQNEPKTSD